MRSNGTPPKKWPRCIKPGSQSSFIARYLILGHSIRILLATGHDTALPKIQQCRDLPMEILRGREKFDRGARPAHKFDVQRAKVRICEIRSVVGLRVKTYAGLSCGQKSCTCYSSLTISLTTFTLHPSNERGWKRNSNIKLLSPIDRRVCVAS